MSAIKKTISGLKKQLLVTKLLLEKQHGRFQMKKGLILLFAVFVGYSVYAESKKGYISRDYWTEYKGGLKKLIANITNKVTPTGSDKLSSFEAVDWNTGKKTENFGDYYAQRVYGFIVPDKTGEYVFFIAGDDRSELYLSSDAKPENSKNIAFAKNWSGAKQWEKSATQKSKKIKLEAGKKYYIEAIMVENRGGDNLAVGWLVPGSETITVIPGKNLMPAEKNKEENKDISKTASKTEPLFINVKDFGAKGDGVADDSDALQRAFDRACKVDEWNKHERLRGLTHRQACRTVVLPAGEYRITKSLVLDPRHTALVIKGTGSGKYGNTWLSWDGEKGGVLLDVWGASRIQITDLRFEGHKKCGTLIRLNSIDGLHYQKSLADKDRVDPAMHMAYYKRFGQRATAENYFSKLSLNESGIGISIGDSSYICSSDMTFDDMIFYKCGTGLITHSPQNVVYHFTRINILFCDTGLYFKKGGFVTCTNLGGSGGGIAIRIGKQGINNGTFNFTGVRVEAEMFNGKRTQMLLAEGGETNIKISSMIVTCQGLFGKNSDRKQPMFVVKDGAHVVVEDSLITGNVAKLTGGWIQFRNCRFRVVSDPRKIKYDKNSGFELNNCVITEDKFNKKGKYIVGKTVMIERLIKRPSYMIKAKKNQGH